MNKKVYLYIILLFASVARAEVCTYPDPGAPVKSSPFYKVSVIQEKKKHMSFVYFSKATFKDTSRTSSWTTFSFNGTVSLEIDVFGEKISNCTVRPLSKNISYKIEGNKIYIDLDKPTKLAIEINKNKKNPLFVFADPPEENVPDWSASGVWYFEPGVHDIGKVEVPDTIQHIYIAGGAYLRGAFINANRGSNFKITGRGIISAEVFEKVFNKQRSEIPDWRDRNPHNVYLRGDGQNVYIEGITFSDGPMYGLIVRQSNSTVRNCKFFGWYYNTDGVSVGPSGLIEDCFFRCNDDAIKVYQNNLIARDCIFWQNDNGAPFQISWNLRSDNHNFRVYDCDVIHCEHHEEANNRAIFNAIHGGEGNLSGYYFENIRIEGDVFRLFKLTIRTSPSDGDPGFGSISNMFFKDIVLDGECLHPNEIWGHSRDHRIDNVIFENLIINGKKIHSAEEGNFKINQNTTSNIAFR